MSDERHGAPFRARRRSALAVLGGAGMWLLGTRTVAGSTPMAQCVLTPAQTEGPFFVDDRLDRSDLRDEPGGGSRRPGALLQLELTVTSIGAQCTPVEGAIVDLWHCDAAGEYSDVDKLKGARFLRGYQRTDEKGIARFTTIYPGAYAGRAVHVHFKVRQEVAGRPREFTSQLYFDDALTDRVHASPPYGGLQRRTRNAGDPLYRHGGRELQLVVADAGNGYAARYAIGLRTA